MIFEFLIFVITAIFICAFVWVFLLRRLRYITVEQLFEPATYNLVIYVFTGLIGIVTVYFFHGSIYFNKVVFNYANERTTIVALLLSLQLTFCISIISRKNWILLRHSGKARVPSFALRDFIILLLVFVVVALCSVNEFSYLLLALGANDQYEVMLLRKTASEGGGDYFFKRAIVEGIGWISVIYYSYLKPKNKIFNLLLVLTVFAFLLYFLTSLKKIQFVFFLISVLGARYYRARISIYGVVFLLICFVLLMFFTYWALVKNVSFEYMLSPFNEGLMGRVFISEISSLYAHLEIFRDETSKLGISSLSSSLSNIVGMEKNLRSGELIMETVNPHWVEMGIGGTYNTIFFGEAYANFGIVGSILSIFYVAIYYRLVLSFILVFLAEYRVPMLIYISINISMMSGFNDFLYDPFLFAIFLMMLSFVCVKEYAKKNYAS